MPRELFKSFAVVKTPAFRGAWGDRLMHRPNDRAQIAGQPSGQVAPEAPPPGPGPLRDSRYALVLLVLLGLATVSVAAATSALSNAHAHRLATDLRL